MIGKIYKSLLPFYDRMAKTQEFKSRPCLIIGQADSGDYVILPISSVSDRSKIDFVYDICLKQSVFNFLKKDSYLRTHKQTVVNIMFLRDEIVDFKKLYSDTYTEALLKVKEFQEQMILKAL